MPFMLTDWDRRRSEFNHDWLRNSYLRSLVAFLARLDRTPDSPIVRDYLTEGFPMWARKREEVRWLAGHLADCLSPKNLFDDKPLSLASAETKAWLPDAVNQVWMLRYHIDEVVAELIARIDAVDTLYEELSRGVQQAVRGVAPIEFRSGFVAYDSACRKLSDTLSDIRKNIRSI